MFVGVLNYMRNRHASISSLKSSVFWDITSCSHNHRCLNLKSYISDLFCLFIDQMLLHPRYVSVKGWLYSGETKGLKMTIFRRKPYIIGNLTICVHKEIKISESHKYSHNILWLVKIIVLLKYVGWIQSCQCCVASYDVINSFFSLYGSTALWILFAFFSLLTLYTVSRTPCTGDQPVARPLPTHRTTQTQNKRKQTSRPWVRFEPRIPAFEQVRTVHALDRVATVIGIMYGQAV
jgi:hypothetical protein